jgi:hypothetical protein
MGHFIVKSLHRSGVINTLYSLLYQPAVPGLLDKTGLWRPAAPCSRSSYPVLLWNLLTRFTMRAWQWVRTFTGPEKTKIIHKCVIFDIKGISVDSSVIMAGRIAKLVKRWTRVKGTGFNPRLVYKRRST